MSKQNLNLDISYQPLVEEEESEQSSNASSPKQTSPRDIELSDQTSKDKDTAGVTLYVYFIAIVVAIGGFLFGYDTGVISSAMLLLEQEFTMTALQKGIIVGAVTLGAVFGGAVAGYLSDLVGRWATSMFAALTFLGGAIVLSVAYTYSLLVVGRLIIGGKIEFGGWRLMFGVSGLPPLIQLFFMPIIPESPRFLIKKGKDEEAKSLLEIGIIHESIAEDETGSYKQLFHYPNLRPLIIACGLQAIQQVSGFDTAMYYGGTIMKMAGFVNIKDAIIFSLVVSLTNFLMTGVALYIIDGVGRRKILIYTVFATILGLFLLGLGFYFTTGFTPKQLNCIDYGNKCGACLLDDRCGFSKRDGGTCLPRNTKSTAASIGKVNFFSPINENKQENDDDGFYKNCPSLKPIYTWFTLVSLVIYVMAYALGLGHAPWLIQSEIFPLNVRGRATGIGTATNWLFNLVISVSFLPLTELITTTGTFWLYAIFMIFSWGYSIKTFVDQSLIYSHSILNNEFLYN
ncbi:proton myo-inositol cotransporter-like [Rhizophagus clarus]|uniref:Proton myo-inositol cotransporter-like n=1 Tax=Rhizophagus clarus TaxID=94130 RepID=A0A8H3L3P3_9GLOM|nr:proton myo-inositol cotransporter-like [Rhizophagus clarus]